MWSTAYIAIVIAKENQTVQSQQTHLLFLLLTNFGHHIELGYKSRIQSLSL
jgi:hypothetical protein